MNRWRSYYLSIPLRVGEFLVRFHSATTSLRNVRTATASLNSHYFVEYTQTGRNILGPRNIKLNKQNVILKIIFHHYYRVSLFSRRFVTWILHFCLYQSYHLAMTFVSRTASFLFLLLLHLTYPKTASNNDLINWSDQIKLSIFLLYRHK